jgi:hypothetical protein
MDRGQGSNQASKWISSGVRHTETFEERLSKEAVKFKEAADKLASRESCSRTASAASYASRDCLQHQQVAELQNFSESLLTRNRMRA